MKFTSDLLWQTGTLNYFLMPLIWSLVMHHRNRSGDNSVIIT
uniref:Uncharacterized protein n=1 Tax=Arundo donax TaxID=35708 RepID=A0A0A9H3X5_ARUDO